MNKSNNFLKNLILHIRYPWTAACLLIIWVGLALMCAILHLSNNEVLGLIGAAGITTIIIALVGFKG